MFNFDIMVSSILFQFKLIILLMIKSWKAIILSVSNHGLISKWWLEKKLWLSLLKIEYIVSFKYFVNAIFILSLELFLPAIAFINMQ